MEEKEYANLCYGIVYRQGGVGETTVILQDDLSGM